ncbi:MAG: hypothetical protein HGJ94_14125 [Desulfosarcina sp.]|nr:hypothetical protein [Desulfosarcina sp.]MBC2741531.1 hypothetical protein [Desulfosarcina sp.]MBC2764445.1 hypothetical protein [Desulfosarcina sp.]
MTDKIILKPGDIFCTRNPMWLGRAINSVQKFNSVDNESSYSHAGIIIDLHLTFESLWTIKKGSLSAYEEKKVLIGRHTKMTQDLFEAGIAPVLKHEGQMYPVWRLVLHLIPPMAKYISNGKNPVCSELVAKFLAACGLLDSWKGRNPDHIADMIRKFRCFDVVFEGVLNNERLGFKIFG